MHLQAVTKHHASTSQQLRVYCHLWFLPSFAWLIPKLSEQELLTSEQHKSQITKAVISLRQGIDSSTNAVKGFEASRTRLVKAHLDGLALKYGYVPAQQGDTINAKKDSAMQSYKSDYTALQALNKHMGARITSSVFLMPKGGDRDKAMKSLTVMRLLKSVEPYVNKAFLQSDILKTASMMYKELRRDKYGPVIMSLGKELREYNDKISMALSKCPAHIVSEEPVAKKLAADLDQSATVPDANIKLIHDFGVIADLYCAINCTVADALADAGTAVETQHKVMAIAPSHAAPEPF